jgi:hypothetical protein
MMMVMVATSRDSRECLRAHYSTKPREMIVDNLHGHSERSEESRKPSSEILRRVAALRMTTKYFSPRPPQLGGEIDFAFTRA